MNKTDEIVRYYTMGYEMKAMRQGDNVDLDEIVTETIFIAQRDCAILSVK